MGHYGAGDLAWVEAKSIAVIDQARAWIADVERLKAQRDQRDRQPPGVKITPPTPEPGSTREESRTARLKAMRLAWEKRGRPWNEAEALAMLADLEARGETRAYGPGGTTLR
jgi:hypothetical protein